MAESCLLGLEGESNIAECAYVDSNVRFLLFTHLPEWLLCYCQSYPLPVYLSVKVHIRMLVSWISVHDLFPFKLSV